MRFDSRGVPILSLEKKIEALKTCLMDGSKEDSLGHLFDLINHVAPGYKFMNFDGIGPLCLKYGSNPTPIEEE